MKTKQVKELKDRSDKDLRDLLAEKRNGLRDFRFGIAGSKVRNVKEGRDLKRDIAQIETELSSRKAE